MDNEGSVVVIGGTSGLGKEVARCYAKRGRDVVISGRDKSRAAVVASEIGGRTRAIGLDLARPEEVAKNLFGCGGCGLPRDRRDRAGPEHGPPV